MYSGQTPGPGPETPIPMYTIAIVGRPNVGKSTLFNRLTRSRRALVHNNPGVTRDRIYGEAEFAGQKVRLIDTGGIAEQTGMVPDEIEKQAAAAMDEADLILMVVDARAGITGSDLETASRLRKRKVPWLVLANKADGDRIELEAGEFYRLGAKAMIPISAEHARGMDEIERAIAEYLPAAEADVPAEEGERYRVAIVGRPNVGKSSLLNRLIGSERMIVLDLPGTTRDTIDTKLDDPAGNFLLVDTAGIRRRSSTERGEEVLSVVLAKKAIDAAEICLLVIDAEAGVTHQDATVAGLVEEAHRAICVVINKFDRIEKDPEKIAHLDEQLRARFAFMAHAPQVRISAKSGKNCNKLLPIAAQLGRRFRTRLSTREVNDLLPKLLAIRSTPLVGGKEMKLKYLTQAQSSPPYFVVFTNREYPPPGDYQRFLINRMREMINCDGVPIILKFKKSGARKEGQR
jgi:GTP-binding protein